MLISALLVFASVPAAGDRRAHGTPEQCEGGGEVSHLRGAGTGEDEESPRHRGHRVNDPYGSQNYLREVVK